MAEQTTSTSSNPKEDLLILAKLSEQSERFEDCTNYVEQLIDLTPELNVEERTLFSVAFKNVVSPKRNSWRKVVEIEQRYVKKSENVKRIELIKNFRLSIEQEIEKWCMEVVRIIDDKLIQASKTGEEKVFYLKMKADNFRYLSEVSQGEKLQQAAQKALDVYQEASNIAEKELASDNPLRLGLGLNFSVFFYEILHDTKKAVELAKKTFDDATGSVTESASPENQKQTTVILQLLRDNLNIWMADLQEAESQPAPEQAEGENTVAQE